MLRISYFDCAFIFWWGKGIFQPVPRIERVISVEQIHYYVVTHLTLGKRGS